jgi:hypothetical protein
MPEPAIYVQVRQFLKSHISSQVDESSLERLVLLVVGIIQAESASPARIADALRELGITSAQADSIERRLRRIENDPEINATLCFHPLARLQLLLGRPRRLLLIVDPTTQEDRLVMVTVAVWYRGRALPLAWTVWPGNAPLEGDRFWQRVKALLDEVAPLLPVGVEVIVLADRAFGSPSFTDLVTAHGWHYLVRVQDQTVVRDHGGAERSLRTLVRQPGQRVKFSGPVFKKRGGRLGSVVVYWGHRHPGPLCLVTDLPPHWSLIELYRRRYPIEATFRDYKSYGWDWERGQVVEPDHVKHLLVGMAIATWVAVLVGAQVATEYLAQPPTGRRRTVSRAGKRSLFRLGLNRLHELLSGAVTRVIVWCLSEWDAPNWHTQIRAHHARAFVFA